MKLLRVQIQFEEHRREIHAERNRRLLGRSRRNKTLEEHNSALASTKLGICPFATYVFVALTTSVWGTERPSIASAERTRTQRTGSSKNCKAKRGGNSERT